MDKYVIIIQNTKDIQRSSYRWHTDSGCAGWSNQLNVFNILQHKLCQTYLVVIIICEDEISPPNISWKPADKADIEGNTITTKFLSVGKVLLQLSDLLPPPGSCLLNVKWYVGEHSSLNIKELSPTLGALKKLKLWHLGEICIVDKEMREESGMMADFIGGVCLPTSSPCICDTTCLWRGSLDVSSSDTQDSCLYSGFSLHKLCKDNILEECNNDNIFCDAFVWVGDVFKLLDVVDINTVPLLYQSDHNFSLKCDKQNPSGKKLMESLKEYRNKAFLCRLDYVLAEEPFSHCKELSSENWRNSLLNGETDLEHRKFHLDNKHRFVHFLLKEQFVPRNDVVSSFLWFKVLALQPLDDINVRTLIELEHNKLYNQQPESKACIDQPDLLSINAEALSIVGEKFTDILRHVIKHWKSKHGDQMPAANLHNIVECTKDVVNNYLETHLFTEENFTFVVEHCHEDSDHNIPGLQALCNREKRVTQPISFLKGTDSVMDALWSSTVSSKAKVGNEINDDGISKLFDKHDCRKILSSLSSLKQNPNEIPELEKLQDFTTALATSYHGISYNVDARSSEKFDRHCRRTVEKLVKYETFSLGSKTQVPSPATMNINDSPTRHAKVLHTPGKKKRLQKVAEKLYKKRAQSVNLQSVNAMVLRSTPTKKKSTNLVKQKLEASPSIHKMSLRSSTPTKDQTNVRRRLASAAPSVSSKKSSQKTYVQDNKKKLQDLVISTLASNGITKDHRKFNKCAKRLYDVSMAFLKDLKSSKGLDLTMRRTVEENVKIVLSFEIGGS